MDNAVQNLVEQVAPPSTVLEPVSDQASGAGPAPSLEDTIKNSLDAVKAEAQPEEQATEVEDTKPEPEVKAKEEKPAKEPEKPVEESVAKPRAKDGKFAKAEADAPAEPVEHAEDQSKDKGEFTPPERLLPDAKERWTNTPRSVQRDISAFVQEVEQERTQYRQQLERYESIRPFDELAKSNGRDLRDSLMKLNHIENMITQNPVAGLDAVLRELGSKYSLYDIAQHVVGQGPQAYQQTVQQATQQVQQSQKDAYVQQLEQQVQQLAVEQKKAQIQAEVIAPFKADHPRFDEPAIQGEMALQIEFLRNHPSYAKQFGDLSYQEQLAIAYERADRIIPASSPSKPNARNSLDPSVDRVEPDSSGTKSVKSSPGAISATEDLSDLSVEELLARNLKKVLKR